jgi:hypothetical protein
MIAVEKQVQPARKLRTQSWSNIVLTANGPSARNTIEKVNNPYSNEAAKYLRNET